MLLYTKIIACNELHVHDDDIKYLLSMYLQVRNYVKKLYKISIDEFYCHISCKNSCI